MEKMIKLNAALVDKIWGGSKLKKNFGKKTDLSHVGESWEVSCHPNGMSTVATGESRGESFAVWLKKAGSSSLGRLCKNTDSFPVLIKFIDAADALSIQVHPDDEYAGLVENTRGKTEMWQVLDCDDGAYLYYGVNQPMTAGEFRTHIENGTILDVLNRVAVKKGDVFFIEAGTVHAIGPGIVICEIQQNSDTTYRVYDFNRTDDKGRARELHIDKAAAVSRLTPPAVSPGPAEPPIAIPGGTRQLLAACPYFTVISYQCENSLSIPITPDSFLSLVCIDGEAEITLEDEVINVQKGENIFVPAQNAQLQVKGCCRLTATTL